MARSEKSQLFCVKAKFKNTPNRWLYINFLGSSKPLKGTQPGLMALGAYCSFQLSTKVLHWIKDADSTDCVASVTIFMPHYRVIMGYDSDRDEKIEEWLGWLNEDWSQMEDKGLEQFEGLQLDTNNFTIIKGKKYVEPSDDMFSMRRYLGKHEIEAACGDKSINKFLVSLKSSRPKDCDWPKFTDETEMFCVQLACLMDGQCVYMNFLARNKLTNPMVRRSTSGVPFDYTKFYWRKDWPNFDYVAFVTIDNSVYKTKSKKIERLRHQLIQDVISTYQAIPGFSRLRNPSALGARGPGIGEPYSILGEGEFVEPSAEHSSHEDCFIDSEKDCEFIRPPASNRLIVKVKLRRNPQKVVFDEGFVLIFDLLIVPICSFRLPARVYPRQPLRQAWIEHERKLCLEFRLL